VIVSGVDESQFSTDDYTPERYAEVLAAAKAEDVALKHPESVVIGADTIVDFDGCIIGKARDEQQAEQITRRIFSAPHRVITGVAVVRLSDNTRDIRSDSTTIHPRKMSDEQITVHIRKGSWKGKAGAYAIKEKGDPFVEKIEGSLTNVMGLPMETLREMLDNIL